jgi:predicted Zn-dependent protease
MKSIVYCLSSIVFFSGCVTSEYNAATHTQDTCFYSTDKEVAMGRSIDAAVKKEYTLLYDTRVIERVNTIGQNVAAQSDRQEIAYYFTVLDDKTQVNAFALPGGYVYIFTGLLDKLKTDDQLAFVLAHEVGHIAARHSVKRAQGMWGAGLLLLGSTQVKSSNGNISGFGSAAVLVNTLLSGYSQEDELTADGLAAEYTRAAGYDPSAGIETMRVLEMETKKEARPRSYFKTHPPVYRRVRKIKETADLPLDFTDIINQ